LRQDPPTQEDLAGIAYGSGRFVCISGGIAGLGPSLAFTSTNGVDWLKQGVTGGILTAITFGQNLFVACGVDAGGGNIATSPDGIEWALHESGLTSTIAGIAYGNGRFVTISGLRVSISEDAMQWSIHELAIDQDLVAIAFGNNTFAALGRDMPGQKVIWTSPDGVNWQPQRTPALEKLSRIGFVGDDFSRSRRGDDSFFSRRENVGAE
jgi:hypothetical protein